MYYLLDVQLDGQKTNMLIQDGHIAAIGTDLAMPGEATPIQGRGYAVLPTFANMHTHAAMSLLRGYGNDLPLMTWLNDYIWPREKHIDDDTVYWGTRLAVTEMIHSGTTLFSDMYFHIPAAARAAAELGIRCTLGINVFGDGNEVTPETIESTLQEIEPYRHLVSLALAPHAIYTVSEKGLRHCAELCQRYGLLYHIHMNETECEVADCLRTHGCRPYELLHRLGVLDLTQGRFSGAHSLHLTDSEVELLGLYHVNVTHNPCSNLKLGSGHFFRYTELRDAGVNVTLGTDGSASSNNLDMIEAAKFMSYLQKGIRKDPTVLPAPELLRVMSANGFHALGINAGTIEVGAVADLMLVDLSTLAFVPNHDTLSNLLYAAHPDCIDTVFCNGRPAMLHRHIESEQETLEQASIASQKLFRENES